MEVEIAHSARKHGISDEEMRHAFRNRIREVALDVDLTLGIGAGSSGRLLEVIVLDLDTDDPCIIHANELSEKFYSYL